MKISLFYKTNLTIHDMNDVLSGKNNSRKKQLERLTVRDL